jgi:hypothetical protein
MCVGFDSILGKVVISKMRQTHKHSNEPRGWKPGFLTRILAEEVGRPHLRRSNPIYAGGLEGITQALYDIYFLTFATVAPKLTLFAQPVGQTYNFGGVTAFAKTYNHTNLSQAGMLEAPNKHIIRSFSVYMQGLQGVAPQLNVIDALNFGATYIQVNINRKPYQDNIIGRLPAGGGIFSSGSNNFVATAGFGNSAVGNGWPFRDNVYALAYGGIPLEQAQNFNAIIDPTVAAGGAWTSVIAAGTTGAAGNGISAWVIFDGTLFRAIQ